MRFAGVLGVALAGLSVIGAVTPMGKSIRAHSTAERQRPSLTTREICACLPTIGPLIRCWAAGPWLKTRSGSKQLHVVYASPGTIAAYRKDGHFPDGTVLVKEVFNTKTKEMTTGR